MSLALFESLPCDWGSARWTHSVLHKPQRNALRMVDVITRQRSDYLRLLKHSQADMASVIIFGYFNVNDVALDLSVNIFRVLDFLKKSQQFLKVLGFLFYLVSFSFLRLSASVEAIHEGLPYSSEHYLKRYFQHSKS